MFVGYRLGIEGHKVVELDHEVENKFGRLDVGGRV